MFTAYTEKIDSIEWTDADGRVEIRTSMGTWAGSMRKDFFCPEEPWEARLIPGARLRFWTISYSRVAGIEWLDEETREWRAVWFVGNDFDTKAVREERAAAYVKFVEDESVVFAAMIDEGKSYAEIEKAAAKDHSGNTFGWALYLGIQRATNRENADRVRRDHNARWGEPEAKGTVNPAVLTIAVEAKA